MKAVGIVAEYNPFHRGHAWQIAETRRRLGEDRPIVCVMSGNWVQRGECALTDKWIRAGMALRGGADLVAPNGGADLVLELPLPWAISSAEGFARGGVAVLKATGVVDTLSFGSESGDLEGLRQIAGILEGEEYRDALRAELDKGISFAEARQRAAAHLMGKGARLLAGPNDSLGVEYLRAAGESLQGVAIPRQGAGHDSRETGVGFASASCLRERLVRGEDVSLWMEGEDIARLQRTGMASMVRVERAMLARLRAMTEADFAALPDSGAAEGLPARLVKAAGKAGTLEEFYALAKTKRYAHARIRRLALWAFLGLTEADRPEGPAYLRVLGTNRRGRALLKEMKTAARLPVLTKPAHIKGLGEEANRLFEVERRGTDLYGLCFEEIRPGGLDLTVGPVIL